MKSKLNISRRDFLGHSAKGTVGLALGASLPNTVFAQNETIKIGMNIPMTGDYAPWGLPGLYGCVYLL